ncbi:M16 family metallopeptidase [Streptomyces toxytricini]|uniref:M16 family metallopeptidase n=1 Tax=Streptomyces toxytricini TaxID=67369 RepID=A0ABW8EHZ0_STRT5
MVLDPHNGRGLVGVSVHYDVGFRTEPADMNGVAHLCEHLLCDGSDPALTSAVLEAGGLLNATTQADYTEYYGVVTADRADTLLRLEAARMATRSVDEIVLREQVAVVKDEIRANIDGKPFGGFPWMWIGEAAYTLPHHRHNGYGAERVESLTPTDVAEFLTSHYAPDSAVLTVSGSFEPEKMVRTIREIFDGIPESGSSVNARRSVRERGNSSCPAEEPLPVRNTVLVRRDPHAPYPATAVTWRAPAGPGLTRELLAAVVLADILVDHPVGRLDRRAAAHDAVKEVGSYLGLFGNPFDGRAPLPFVVEVFHGPELDPPAVVEFARLALTEIAEHGIDQAEVTRTARRIATQVWRTQDQIMGRTLMLGSIELIHGAAAGVSELPAALAEVTAADVCSVARDLLAQQTATLTLEVGQ